MDTTLYHPGVSDDSVKLLARVISLLIPKRRRKYPLALIVSALLHRVDNGSKWRALDRGAALPWHVAYDYYRRRARDYVLETANALIVSALRLARGVRPDVRRRPGAGLQLGPPDPRVGRLAPREHPGGAGASARASTVTSACPG